SRSRSRKRAVFGACRRWVYRTSSGPVTSPVWTAPGRTPRRWAMCQWRRRSGKRRSTNWSSTTLCTCTRFRSPCLKSARAHNAQLVSGQGAARTVHLARDGSLWEGSVRGACDKRGRARMVTRSIDEEGDRPMELHTYAGVVEDNYQRLADLLLSS